MPMAARPGPRRRGPVGPDLGRQGRHERPDRPRRHARPGPDRPPGRADQRRHGHRAGKVALVSSGAVGAGIGQLGLATRPDNLRQLQAAAAVGQAYLIRAYDEGFRRHGRHAAQLLLTHEDFDSRPRYLNMRNTLTALFECDAVPIINENDTISVDEIKFGDNDRLAAMVTNLLQAPLLVILSVVDGLYRDRPRRRGRRARSSRSSPTSTTRSSAWPATSRSALGTGGMRSKLQAARLVTQAGGSVDHRLGQEARAADPDPRRRAGRHPVPRPGRDPGAPGSAGSA